MNADEKTTAEEFLRLSRVSDDAAARVGPLAAPVLIAELERLTRLKRRMSKVRWVLVGLVIAYPLSFFPLMWLGVDITRLPFNPIFGLVPTLLGLFATAAPMQNALAKALKEWGGVEAVGPLAQALRIEGIDRKIVTDALARILPQMQASDAHLLDSVQRAALRWALKLYPYPFRGFLIELLGALQRIGDVEAIPTAERMAQRVGGPVHDEVLQAAARRCLEGLREAERRTQQAASLLRAADGMQPTATLLRPADSNQMEAALLLRVESGMVEDNAPALVQVENKL